MVKCSRLLFTNPIKMSFFVFVLKQILLTVNSPVFLHKTHFNTARKIDNCDLLNYCDNVSNGLYCTEWCIR